MKRCPSCQRFYVDDSLTYCLEDGSILSSVADPDATLVRPGRRSSGHTPYLWAALVLILLVAVLLGGGAVAFVYELNRREPSVSTSRPDTDPPSVKTTTPSPEPIPAATQRPANTRIERRTQTTADLSGQWQLVNTIQKSSYPSYINLQLGYSLSINQGGTEFSGEGEKVSENGRALSATERTPIHVSGSIVGEIISASFIEEGARRTTSGRFTWQVADDGNRITGTFVSTAAKSSGICAGTRER